jgi:long-chain acyl-CoA synthetase
LRSLGSLLPVAYATALEMASSACARRGEEPLLHYFGTALSGARVEMESDALAAALARRGVGKGDRVALYLQNIPQFPIALIAIWKLGAIAVTVNPMLRERELAGILRDSEPAALIGLEDLHESVAARVLADVPVDVVITTSPLDYLGDGVPSLLADLTRTRSAGTEDLVALIAEHAGERPPEVELGSDDVATIVYTSGTTGPAKGAMNSHGNVVFASSAWAGWVALGADDVNLALAPLFHVTGLIAAIGASLSAGAPLVLGYRFDAETTLELIERYRPTFTVAAITAYAALMQSPRFADVDLSSLRATYTGGAPVAPATAAAWRHASGVRIHNAYGLTETTSPLTLTPLGLDAPVDPDSGALSVGVPVFDSTIEVIGDDGERVAPGTAGEIVASGPQVITGYWQKPAESAHALPDGRLRTGDVGVMDENGWVFLVDRRKDLIIASGYKVWPREVEDVLYTHPAVREAAVVGVPDDYRGETVKAFVSLAPGSSVDADELKNFCRERMAAYKYPRLIEIRDSLPKSASGKILRRELRAADGS